MLPIHYKTYRVAQNKRDLAIFLFLGRIKPGRLLVDCSPRFGLSIGALFEKIFFLGTFWSATEAQKQLGKTTHPIWAYNFATSWRIWLKLCTIVKLIPGKNEPKGLVNRASAKKVMVNLRSAIFSFFTKNHSLCKAFGQISWNFLDIFSVPVISWPGQSKAETFFGHFLIWAISIFGVRQTTHVDAVICACIQWSHFQKCGNRAKAFLFRIALI